MTMARDVIEKTLQRRMGALVHITPADADAIIADLKSAPEPVRLELAAPLNPKPKLPEQRCDECDNGIEAAWNWCAWCGCNLTLPVPPSEQMSATTNDNGPPPLYDPAADRRDELRKQGVDVPARNAEEEVIYQQWKKSLTRKDRTDDWPV